MNTQKQLYKTSKAIQNIQLKILGIFWQPKTHLHMHTITLSLSPTLSRSLSFFLFVTHTLAHTEPKYIVFYA